jgi:predicted DNA binding CopG/RHH family protein
MGRPPIPKAERRSKRIELRLSAAELRQLERKARAKGLNVSEFLRDCGKD